MWVGGALPKLFKLKGRNLCTPPPYPMRTTTDVPSAPLAYRYKELCRIAYNFFEDRHDMGHRVVSGHMSDVNCSPSDPLFFIFHGYMDYLWEVFRTQHQQTDPQMEYPSEDHGGEGHDAGVYIRIRE